MQLSALTILLCSSASFASSSLNVSSDQKAFKQGEVDVDSLPLFQNKQVFFDKHDSSFYKDITDAQMNVLFDRFGKNDVISAMTTTDFKSLGDNKEVCENIAEEASSIDRKAIAGVSKECFQNIVAKTSAEFLNASMISNLSDKVFSSEDVALFNALESAKKLNYLNEKQFTTLLKGLHDKIDVRNLYKIETLLKTIRTEYFPKFLGWNEFRECHNFMRYAPSNLFEHFAGDADLHPNVYSAMGPKHVETFASKLSKDEKETLCTKMRIDLLSPYALTALRPECFNYYSSATPADKPIAIGKKLVFTPPTILRNFTKDKKDELANMDPSDWLHFGAEHFQYMPAEVCAAIPKEVDIVENTNFKPTPKCFAALKTAHQIAFIEKRPEALTNPKILAFIARKGFTNWTPAHVRKFTKEQLTVLGDEYSPATKNDAKDHPCSQFESYKDFAKRPELMAALSSEHSCAKAIAENFFEKAPLNVLRQVSPKAVDAIVPKKYIENVNAMNVASD